MKIEKFLLRRLLQGLFVLIGLSILIFIIARIIPGDPARLALGPRAPKWAVEQLREEMDLDKSIPEQYVIWLKKVVKGDFGKSLTTKRPVIDDLKQFLPGTIEIIIIALFIEAIGSIILGVITAVNSGKWFDSIIRIISYLGVSAPAFIWAILLMLIFGYVIPVLPIMGRVSKGLVLPPTVTGMLTIDSLISGNFEVFRDAFCHLLLPAISLSLAGLSQSTRITRVSMIETLDKDYIWASKTEGIPFRKIIYKYALKPSMPASVSIIALDMASMLANAFMVELVFNYPGFSRYGINAILSKDSNSIVGVVLLIGLVFLLVNILADLINSKLDPRTIL